MVLGVLGACSGPSEPPAVASVAVTPLTSTLYIGPGGGQSVQMTATPQRDDGRALTGRVVTWATNAPAVVNVSATGLVTALTAGSATVTATSETQIGSVTVTVAPVPAAVVVVTPSSLSLGQGLTQQLSAVVRDSAGNNLSGRPVTWTSSALSVATVSTIGILTAVGQGEAVITAAREGRSTTVAVTVTPPPGPSISGVSPATLVPGGVVTLTGAGFAPSVSENTLQIRGVSVPIQSATPTALTFVMPCITSGNAGIQVTTAVGQGAVVTVPVAVTTRALAVGESVVLTSAAASQCNEIPAAGTNTKYLVMATNSSLALNTLVDIELAGNTPAVTDPVVRSGSPATRAALSTPRTAEAVHDAAHAAHMERERILFASLRSSGAFDEARRSRRANAVAPPVLGDRRLFYYNFPSCSDSTNTFGAKVVYAGTRAIVWEDTLNTLQSSVDAGLAGYYTRLGQIFDTDQYDAVKDNFGDPLRRDALTDDDGRIHMVFTQKLNGTGAAAYVTSCDMTPRNTTNRAASNNGELFYGTVPTSAGANVNSSAFADGWFYFMGRTVVHEVKHIASLSARIANASPSFEAGWLEEGTARHAEEVWVRAAMHRVAWKGNTGYGTAASNGLFCDFNPANATCLANDPLRRPGYGMRRQFNEIRPKMLEPWAWSPYGDGTGQSGSVFYNTAWSLVRYAIDRYGTSDAAFLTALTQSTATGMANISAVAGVPTEQIIANWGLALYLDDFPGLGNSNPDLQIATWDFRNIYAGLNADPLWSARFNTPYPIAPTNITSATFLAPRPGLRAGSHAYFEITATPGQAQLLHLRGSNNTPLSSLVRLAIVRIN